MTIHEMLGVHRTTISFRGGCIYKRVDVIAVCLMSAEWTPDTVYFIF